MGAVQLVRRASGTLLSCARWTSGHHRGGCRGTGCEACRGRGWGECGGGTELGDACVGGHRADDGCGGVLDDGLYVAVELEVYLLQGEGEEGEAWGYGYL